MSRLVGWAAENRLLALLVIALLTVLGVNALRQLPIDAVPDVTPVQVQVVTRAPALGVADMESNVTQPVERAMAGLPGLRQVRSITKFGISIVWLTFNDDTDTYFARAQVNERLSLVRDRIPSEFGHPELGPISTGLGEIYMFELESGTPARSQEELRTIVKWQVAPRLRQVPGVIEVVAFGGSLKQYQVILDAGRLAAHSLSIEQVRTALLRDNAVSGGGSIESEGEQVVLSGDSRFRSLEDIAATVVRTDEQGLPIRVGHLGTVKTGPALRQGAMTRDGRGEIVGGSVLLLKGENSRDVVTRVKERIAEVVPMLPAGVTIAPYYDRTEFINGVIATITRNLSEGALITIACLLLTLGSLRAGLLVAGAIPFSLLIGFIGLRAAGYSGNVMSLGAVDFGIIVEGTVLVVEHALGHATGDTDPSRRLAHLVAAGGSSPPCQARPTCAGTSRSVCPTSSSSSIASALDDWVLIERFELAPLFERVFIEQEVGVGKPDPAVYRHVLSEMRAAPEDCCMVGDNLAWDVLAPKSLGIGGIWNDWRGKGLPPNSPVKPDRIVHSIAELLPQRDGDVGR